MLKYLFLILVLGGCSNTEISNDKKEHLLLKGINSYSNGDNQKALKYYEEILKKDKNNELVLEEVGIINAKLENYDKARLAFEKVLEIDENNIRVIQNLALLEFKEQNYSRAIKVLKTLPKGKFRNQENYILGYSYYKLKNYNQSFQNFQKIDKKTIVNDDESLKIYLYILSENLNSQEKYKELKELKKEEIDNRKSILLLSNAFQEEYNDFNSSETILKRYLYKNNLEEEILIELAKLYYRTKNKLEYNKIIKLLSKNYSYNLEYI